MLKIPQEVVDALIAHAREEAPLEACGYLGEKDGIVCAAYRLTNADAATDHFSLKPEEQFAVLRSMRAEGITLRAVYHSHPSSEASPSQEDIRLAHDREISYVIVSLLGLHQTVRSFRIREMEVTEERLDIAPKRENETNKSLTGEQNIVRFYEIPPSLAAEIEELEHLIARYRQGEVEGAKFRAYRVPFGIYEQRTPETYMTRIRCTAGGITPHQLRTVALLSEKYGADTIHITTRQEVQIHDVLLDSVSPILRELAKVGLSSRGGGGNTVRNIMASWDAGISPHEVFDVTPYAVSLTSRLIAEPDSWVLPRKFKIAFSNSDEDNAHGAFNDLGFIARREQGREGFLVYVAGGMGVKPQRGYILHRFVEAHQVYRVTEAIKRVFDRYGNRKNKHAARLRFLWNKLGEEKFRELYGEEFDKLETASLFTVEAVANEPAKASLEVMEDHSAEFRSWKRRFARAQKQPGLFSILIPVTLGKLSCRHALALADFLAHFGENCLRFTMEQNLAIRNIPERYLGNVFGLAKVISDISLAPRFYGNCIACTGADTCKLGICLSRGALSAVMKKLERLPFDLDALGDFHLNISGCPNSCGAHLIADFGFYGQVGRRGQRMYPSYAVVAGARVGGEAPRLAGRMGTVSARDLPDFTASCLSLYLKKKDRYGDFAHYVDGEGREDMAALCERYGGIPDFRDDKNYYFDWGADELFSLAGKGVGECSAGLFDLIDLDLESIRERRQELKSLIDEDAVGKALYGMTLSAARMLLITRGVEALSEDEVFDNFRKHFIGSGLIDGYFLPLLDQAKNGTMDKGSREEVFALAEAVEKLYEGMDDSLKFQPEKEKGAVKEETGKGVEVRPREAERFKDLRGVACPMNFVKTKLELARIKSGELLRIYLDDGEPIYNVPRSVAEEGHRVVEQIKTGDYWSVLIEKR